MKILFMGTPEFAKISLEYLVENNFNVSGVITQPDKPAGRKMILSLSPVKEYALQENIPVYQPITSKDENFFDLLKNINPDIIVVVAYGNILPKNVIDYPKYGCINVHASLLPKYRGAAPINAAIINGEKITGITTIFMNEGIDTGDMILKESTEIGENETFGELHDRLAQIGGKVLINTLEQIQNGTAKREKQPDNGASYVKKTDNDACEIDWNLSAKEIHDKIRGLSPSPAAFMYLNGKKLKIYKSKISGDGIVELLEVQLEGGRRMNAGDFINGRKNEKRDDREGSLFKFSR
ncbi:MAG: methionyl-tRNA formyltransferase [Oscillospiraceae bacterium]|nr:methionyl-tRNA formyltransferase [Oscillospiraceae bacterium]